VAAQGSDGYVAPHEPAAPAAERYMVVRRVLGGAWGIVDRHRGRLVDEVQGVQSGGHVYASWTEALLAARALNGQSAQ
jgi:hypothetical protein